MTLEERAMQLYGEHFEGLDKMTQESIRKDCVTFAASDMLAAMKGIKKLFAYPSPFFIKKLGGQITNGDQKGIDDAFIALDAAIEKGDGLA